MRTKIYVTIMAGIMVMAACTGTSTGSLITPTGEMPLPTPTQSPGGSQVSPDLTPAQLAAIEMAAKKYSLPIEKITIVSTEAVTWPDGCLGVVVGDRACTDALVDGFRIILEANGQQYEFHTNQDGTLVVDATGVTQ